MMVSLEGSSAQHSIAALQLALTAVTLAIGHPSTWIPRDLLCR